VLRVYSKKPNSGANVVEGLPMFTYDYVNNSFSTLANLTLAGQLFSQYRSEKLYMESLVTVELIKFDK
jgi:hypothetical protein